MYWRRKLPHWVPEMVIVFVTWKLEGTAPEPEPEVTMKDDVPRYLGGPKWLADPRIAEIVAEALKYGEQSGRYELLAWAIMPNHVHIVILPKKPLKAVINWLKSASAVRANRILGRTGQHFWMREYYDRWMRSDAEISKTIAYVEGNPVRAGLVRFAGRVSLVQRCRRQDRRRYQRLVTRGFFGSQAGIRADFHFYEFVFRGFVSWA